MSDDEESKEKWVGDPESAGYHCNCKPTSPLKCGDENKCNCKLNEAPIVFVTLELSRRASKLHARIGDDVIELLQISCAQIFIFDVYS